MGRKVNLINGHFITLDKHCPTADTISIDQGKISAINSIDYNCKTIDVKGSTIIPGFVDAHFHLSNFGMQLDTLQLNDCLSHQEIADMVLEKSKQINKNEWITGFGWDQTKWTDKEFPKSHILNKLAIPNPIILTRIDGHACWTNQQAMSLSGLDVSPNYIDGGDIINDCILIDNAMNPLKSVIPKPDEQLVEKWIKSAIKIIISRGITNIHDAWQSPTVIKVLKFLNENDDLPIRVYGMLGSSHQKLLTQFFKSGHYITDYYSIRSVKAFIDGALGSRGAALLQSYSDDKNNCGLILISAEEFNNIALNCRKAGFQLCTHAIGDRGNRMVLDIYSDVTKAVKNHRWRIEHAQMVCDEDIPRFAKAGIIPSMQPSHCTSDMRWMDDRIGKNRLARISRWNSFIKSGCKIPGGSDCPIEDGNPIFEYYAAVTRKDHLGLPNTGWQSQEAVNRLDALKMFTTWAAYGEFAEHKRGKIRPGFDADLTFLSQDILNCHPDAILKTEILGTMVAGKFLFNKLT